MKLLVSVPNQGWIHKLVTHTMVALAQDPRVTLITPTWKPYEHNMNRIAKDFLVQGFDWWLNIDADNPPMSNPLTNLNLYDHEVVGFPTPVWRDDGIERPYYWNAMKVDGEGYQPFDAPALGVYDVDAVGSGCVLFHHSVVQGVREEFGPPFIRTYDEDGLVQDGPDFLFCRRAKGLGYKVAVDTRCPCRHFSEIDLTTMTQRFEQCHG